MKKKNIVLFLIIFVILIFTACPALDVLKTDSPLPRDNQNDPGGSATSPSPSASASATESATPSPSGSASESPTPSPSASAAESPTPSPTVETDGSFAVSINSVYSAGGYYVGRPTVVVIEALDDSDAVLTDYKDIVTLTAQDADGNSLNVHPDTFTDFQEGVLHANIMLEETGSSIAGPITITASAENDGVNKLGSGNITSDNDEYHIGPEGTELSDIDEITGKALGGTFYLAAESSHTANADVIVPAGTKLIIADGVTIDMGSNAFIVNGEISVRGLPDNPVSFTGSDWSGMKINSSDSNSWSEIIGTEFKDFSSSAYGILVGSESTSKTNFKLLHSTIVADGYSAICIGFKYVDGGTHYIYNNNLIKLGSSWSVVALESNITDIEIDIAYNTLLTSSTPNYAFYINSVDACLLKSRANIISGFDDDTFGAAFYFVNNNVNLQAMDRNVIYQDSAVDSAFANYSGNYTPYHNIIDDKDNDFTPLLNAETYMKDPNFGDYTLQASNEFPTAAQLESAGLTDDNGDGWPDMVGCLQSGHVNEIGAYGNGGYAP